MKHINPSSINVTPNTSDIDDDDTDNNEDTNCEELGSRMPEINKVYVILRSTQEKKTSA